MKIDPKDRKTQRCITLSENEVEAIKYLTEERTVSGGIRQMIRMLNDGKLKVEPFKYGSGEGSMKKLKEIAAKKLPKKSDL